jgi:hypothetical protein
MHGLVVFIFFFYFFFYFFFKKKREGGGGLDASFLLKFSTISHICLSILIVLCALIEYAFILSF